MPANRLPRRLRPALAATALLALIALLVLLPRAAARDQAAPAAGSSPGKVLALVGGLVHKALGLLLLVPLYIAFLLLIYVVMFGVMYYMWRDICGDAPVPTLLSMICKPEAVVMGFPAVWADAVTGTAIGVATAAAAAAKAV